MTAVNRSPARAAPAAPPGVMRFAPWTDRRGRFHPLRAAVFVLLLVPATWLAWRWSNGGLGPQPVNAAIHSTGYAAVWTLLASLAVTPAKSLLNLPNLIVVRRMLGNGALLYAVAHLVLYCMDEKWQAWTIVSEIVLRFYLTIGFVALLGLLVLGATSTDGWIRAMGRNWKRLHRLSYVLAVLVLAHYVLQTKLDVSQAMLAIGVFVWFMLWRALPAGREADWPVLLGLSLVAAAATLGTEYLWYDLATRVHATKVVLGEFDIQYGLHPAGQVLALGLLATGIAELCCIGATPFGDKPSFTVGVYALGAFADNVVPFVLAWQADDATGLPPVLLDLVWAVPLGVLGAARWTLRTRWYRHLVDAVWLACLGDQILHAGVNRPAGAVVAVAVTAGASVLALRVWRVSRGAAVMLVPLVAALMLEVFSLV